jgi:hypothetical protein
MANWQIGDLKIRGKVCDIVACLSHCIEQNNYGFWVNGVRRSYFDQGDYDGACEQIDDAVYDDELGPDDMRTFVFENLHNAWGITPAIARQWADLSKKYHVDFRFYGFEMGMQFEQEMIVVEGEVETLRDVKYDDYSWESIRPYVGG